MPKSKKLSMAFSGCGFLAPIHGGVACQLMDKGSDIVEVSGASGGSIIAAAVAVGMNSEEIRNVCLESDFKDLLRLDIWSLVRGVAYCSGERLEAFFHGLFGDITFQETLKDLKVVATNLQTGKPFVFSKQTTPDCPVYVACRASTAIPFIYESYDYKGVTLVDGGESCNVPARFLSHGGTKKIAIVIKNNTPNDLSTFLGRASANLSNLLSDDEDLLIDLAKTHGVEVVSIINDTVSFLDNTMSDSDKLRLFEQGYQTRVWK